MLDSGVAGLCRCPALAIFLHQTGRTRLHAVPRVRSDSNALLIPRDACSARATIWSKRDWAAAAARTDDADAVRIMHYLQLLLFPLQRKSEIYRLRCSVQLDDNPSVLSQRPTRIRPNPHELQTNWNKVWFLYIAPSTLINLNILSTFVQNCKLGNNEWVRYSVDCRPNIFIAEYAVAPCPSIRVCPCVCHKWLYQNH